MFQIFGYVVDNYEIIYLKLFQIFGYVVNNYENLALNMVIFIIIYQYIRIIYLKHAINTMSKTNKEDQDKIMLFNDIMHNALIDLNTYSNSNKVIISPYRNTVLLFNANPGFALNKRNIKENPIKSGNIDYQDFIGFS